MTQRLSHMPAIFFLALMAAIGTASAQLSRPEGYFQQELATRIDVTLNDRDHLLTAFMSLDYTNHSPDTLDFIWFHLWPNAYRNDETAFARQKFDLRSTKFHFSREEDRGGIDSLDFRVDGQSLRWEQHPQWIDVAKVSLSRPLPPGESVTIETPFRVKIPKMFSRLGRAENHYEISQWYPKPAVYDPEGWHPMPYLNMGEFYSEFGSFDVRITLPSEYVIMATGDLPAGDPEYAFLDSLAEVTAQYYALKTTDDKPDKRARRKLLKEFKQREFAEPGEGPTKTLHFHQENVHDFAWFADKRYLVQKDTLWADDSGLAVGDTAQTRPILLWALFLPQFADLWEDATEYLYDATAWYGTWYGTYPYNHVSAVSGDLAAGGGMEYPNITVISIGGNSKQALETVIMHEVGHNWHYGIFGYDEREHPWLDEGLNSYSEIRYWYAKYGDSTGARFSFVIPDAFNRRLNEPFDKRTFHQWLTGLTIGQKDDQPMEGHSTGFERMNYGLVVYYKTSVVFDFLEHYLGEERNQAAWDAFARTWSFAHPGPENIRTAFETTSGEDLAWLFDDLIPTTRRMDYGVSRMDSRGDSVEVTVTNFGNLAAPVEVATLGRDGQVLASRWLPGFTGSQTARFGGRGVVSASTDPGGFAPDVDRSNDLLPKLRLGDIWLHKPAIRPLLGAPDPSRSVLFVLPAIYETGYSGTLLGATFYSGILPPQKNTFSANIFYSPKLKRLAGGTGLTFKRYRLWGADELMARIGYRSYPEMSDLSLTAKGTYRARAVRSPTLTVAATLSQQNLTTAAFDTLWDTGAITAFTLDAEYRDRTHALFDWRVRSGLKVLSQPDKETSALLAQLEARASYQYARKGKLHLRGWLGHTFADVTTVPRQHRFWLSGGLDPGFENFLAFNRTGTGILALYSQAFLPNVGPGLHAFNDDLPGATAYGLNLNLTSRFPVSLFADVAGSNNSTDWAWQTYADAGIALLRLGPFELIVPLWVSWEPDDGRQPYEAWRIRLNSISFGF